jgi:hypothetical protein
MTPHVMAAIDASSAPPRATQRPCRLSILLNTRMAQVLVVLPLARRDRPPVLRSTGNLGELPPAWEARIAAQPFAAAFARCPAALMCLQSCGRSRKATSPDSGNRRGDRERDGGGFAGD